MSSAASRIKNGKFAKIDLDDDEGLTKTYSNKGERGRKSLTTGLKDKDGKRMVARFDGARGGISYGMTVGEEKAESGWWWMLPMWKKSRVLWRCKMVEEEYSKTYCNKEWRKKNKANLSMMLKEGIDFYFGRRIKLKYSYVP